MAERHIVPLSLINVVNPTCKDLIHGCIEYSGRPPCLIARDTSMPDPNFLSDLRGGETYVKGSQLKTVYICMQIA